MNAIIYAAGRAARLQALGASRNKVLLEFNGVTLLERHAASLASIGVRTLHVVTGHLRERIAETFPGLRARYRIEIEELYNPDYLEGSALSMLASLPALTNLQEPVLIMDGDVLCDGRMLVRLIQSVHPTALLIDRDYSLVDDDPVLVPVRDGKPFEFRKKWKGHADIVGESVGFFRIDPAHVPFLVRETRARSEGAGRADSYDEILRAMVVAGLFGAIDITGLPWTEIDFPHDLEFAERYIVPALQAPAPAGR